MQASLMRFSDSMVVLVAEQLLGAPHIGEWPRKAAIIEF